MCEPANPPLQCQICDHGCPRSKLFDFSVVCRWRSEWWSQTGSNRRPHACKARALPTELWPRLSGQSAGGAKVVGLGRLELPTSRLSSARSNQLSYKPDEASSSGSRTNARETTTEKGRETKAAARRRLSSDDVWDREIRKHRSLERR